MIYNPVNLASMIKGMKNTTITREQKIAIRKTYEQNQSKLSIDIGYGKCYNFP